jgi:hypothetical protein
MAAASRHSLTPRPPSARIDAFTARWEKSGGEMPDAERERGPPASQKQAANQARNIFTFQSVEPFLAMVPLKRMSLPS